MKESEIRQEIKNHLEELLSTGKFEEYHELVSSSSDWAQEKRKLDLMVQSVFDLIESDDYEQAIKAINKSIMKLGAWKTKLSKVI